MGFTRFLTFSEYCERSTWQLGTNVINQTFWCASHLFTLWSFLNFVMLIMEYRLQFWQQNTIWCNINIWSWS